MHAAVDPSETDARISSGDLTALADHVKELDVDDLVAAITALPTADGAVVFRLLDKDTAIAVFDRLRTGAQTDLVTELGTAPLAGLFAGLPPGVQARLLDELPAKVAKRLIRSVEPGQLGPVMGLLGYPDGSVGRRITTASMRADVDETAGQVAARLRARTDDVAAVPAVPVLSRGRVLRGVLDPLRALRADPGTPVAAIMDADPDTARTSDEAEHVARRVLDRGTLLLPVVDAEHRLVGMLPIGEAARIDRDAVAQDQARAGASERLRRPYLLTPVRRIARARIVWLLVLAISAVLTVHVLDLFEATLSQQVALALFIPLLTGIGGNTGSQAATTVTRALATGEVALRDTARVAFKEVRTGFFLGLLLAVPAFAVAALVYGVGIGVVIAVTITLNCPIAATVGGVVPLLARACRVDPAVFSTPFISTFCDASGLLVYFTVAITVLGL